LKLYYARCPSPNFGDELNSWMWPQILPDFFDDDDSVLFFGIGSIISARFSGPQKKIVFGTGFVGDYAVKPDLTGGDWEFYFVRGPHTAASLGLPSDLAVGDSALLVRALVDLTRRTDEVISFIPHWESSVYGAWPSACELAGINLIDPRRPVTDVIAEILRSRLVICEAMHGAIVADALRVPWVPMRPINPKHRKKWRDWSDAYQLKYVPRHLLPSSLVEIIPDIDRRPNVERRARALLGTWPIKYIQDITVDLAARCLARAADAQANLSDGVILNQALDKMLEKVDLLKRNRIDGLYDKKIGS
jgi:hypothetical protein